MTTDDSRLRAEARIREVGARLRIAEDARNATIADVRAALDAAEAAGIDVHKFFGLLGMKWGDTDAAAKIARRILRDRQSRRKG